jgi:5'-3' exonuclease
MCGTDYNSRIPGIGPVKAYNLVKKHGRIENMGNIIEKLDYITPRRMFTQYTPWSGKLEYCGQPIWNDLLNFLGGYGVIHDEEKLREAFEPVKITIISS